MIRVATFDELDPKLVKDLCKILYQAFAVGAEHSGTVAPPAGMNEPWDPHKLLDQAPKVSAFQDDKILYITQRKLMPRKLQTGEVPTFGLSQYTGQRALVSFAHVKNPAENLKQTARFALHELGHTWGLHHCLDPRCAMYPHWTPSYPAGDATFCVFCRETSEQKIRLAKS
jgi:predicted Zn-dependent protease